MRLVVANCQVCKFNGPAPPHAAGTPPRANRFNILVDVDLFFLRGTPPIPVLYAIDHLSRFSKCNMLPLKTAKEAGNAFLSWVVTFGAPRDLLHDDAGEVVNDLWHLIGDRFGIQLDATAAQFQRRNGLYERHNAVIKPTYNKILAKEPAASTQLLLFMACLAKNSLLVHGSATPHQLMCGT